MLSTNFVSVKIIVITIAIKGHPNVGNKSFIWKRTFTAVGFGSLSRNIFYFTSLYGLLDFQRKYRF